ncbi:signal peptidase II [Paenibacillus sp. B01]|uniref:signal peptidase II n=1 Tax=Paenibacillus sp. B01 TaxID=2660554 RepID=UPI001E524EAA|nr:signal peptidase II [Paenibacillus sp. B01]
MLYYLALSVILIAIDQISKWLITVGMDVGGTIPLLPDIFHLTSIRNRGAAFSILWEQRGLLIVIAAVVSAFVLYYLKRIHQSNKSMAIGLSFILSGALGNLIDRLLRAEVVDMFDLRLINFPVFNVADCFVTVGVGCIIISNLRESRAQKEIDGMKPSN